MFNVLTGAPRTIGATLTADPRVAKLTFTGSTEVGRTLMAQCAPTVKKLSLELGGNAPFIVFDDADIDAAVEGVLIAKFRNNGQTCVCANRIFAQSNIHDEFVSKLSAAISLVKVGDGFAVGTDFGPLISVSAVAKVQKHVDDALSLGAKLHAGGAGTQRVLIFLNRLSSQE